MNNENQQLKKIFDFVASQSKDQDVFLSKWKEPILNCIQSGGNVNALDPQTKLPLFVKVCVDDNWVAFMKEQGARIITLGSFGFFDISVEGLQSLMKNGFNPTAHHENGSFAQQLKAQIIKLNLVQPAIVGSPSQVQQGQKKELAVALQKMEILLKNGVPGDFLLNGSPETVSLFYTLIQKERINQQMKKIEHAKRTDFDVLEQKMREMKRSTSVAPVPPVESPIVNDIGTDETVPVKTTSPDLPKQNIIPQNVKDNKDDEPSVDILDFLGNLD